jgi:putative FmdB family regulatory protein
MPTYIYRCARCRRKQEIFHDMSALAQPRLCSRCGGELSRIIGDFPHVRFDYKAWYTADEGTRLILHGSKAGKKSPASEIAGKRT